MCNHASKQIEREISPVPQPLGTLGTELSAAELVQTDSQWAAELRREALVRNLVQTTLARVMRRGLIDKASEREQSMQQAISEARFVANQSAAGLDEMKRQLQSERSQSQEAQEALNEQCRKVESEREVLESRLKATICSAAIEHEHMLQRIGELGATASEREKRARAARLVIMLQRSHILRQKKQAAEIARRASLAEEAFKGVEAALNEAHAENSGMRLVRDELLRAQAQLAELAQLRSAEEKKRCEMEVRATF